MYLEHVTFVADGTYITSSRKSEQTMGFPSTVLVLCPGVIGIALPANRMVPSCFSITASFHVRDAGYFGMPAADVS